MDAVQYFGKIEKENRGIVKSIKSITLYQNSMSYLREQKGSYYEQITPEQRLQVSQIARAATRYCIQKGEAKCCMTGFRMFFIPLSNSQDGLAEALNSCVTP